MNRIPPSQSIPQREPRPARFHHINQSCDAVPEEKTRGIAHRLGRSVDVSGLALHSVRMASQQIFRESALEVSGRLTLLSHEARHAVHLPAQIFERHIGPKADDAETGQNGASQQCPCCHTAAGPLHPRQGAHGCPLSHRQVRQENPEQPIIRHWACGHDKQCKRERARRALSHSGGAPSSETCMYVIRLLFVWQAVVSRGVTSRLSRLYGRNGLPQ